MYQEHGAGVSINHRNSARKTPETNFPVVSTQPSKGYPVKFYR